MAKKERLLNPVCSRYFRGNWAGHGKQAGATNKADLLRGLRG